MDKVTEYINKELKKMDRGIVATPESREFLDSFSRANQGSMDMVLTQMAVNWGYKIALENVAHEIHNKYE
jgi:hypothetical protein|tara:strand:- start:2318 stop:2527 length:210 start_codon:yes stop_codon:yes gene_type:complete